MALASAAGRNAAVALEEMARLRHSQDNVTVIVVHFDWGHAATFDAQARAVAGPPLQRSSSPPLMSPPKGQKASAHSAGLGTEV